MTRSKHRSLRLAWALAALTACTSTTTAERRETVPAKVPEPRSPPAPEYLTDPESACPRAQFIFAIGESEKGPDEALTKARQRVAEQVSSRIQVAISQTTSERKVGAKRLVDFVNLEEVKQKSEFQRGELMVPQGPAHTRRGLSRTLVCLDRKRARDALEQEVAPDLAAFDARAADAMNAREKLDYAAFTASFQEANQLAKRCLPTMYQISAVSAGQDESTDRFLTRFQSLVGAAAELRSTARFGVKVVAEGFPEEVRQQLVSNVCSSIQGQSLPCAPANDCNGLTYLVTLTGKPNCRFGGLGYTCQPELALAGTECRSKREAFVSPFSGAALKGSNVKDEEKALRKALLGLGSEQVSAWVLDSLSREIPVQSAPRGGNP